MHAPKRITYVRKYKITITTDNVHTMNEYNIHTKLVRWYKINNFMIGDDFVTEEYDVEWRGSVD